MCGLVGIAGQMTSKDDVTLKRLLMYDFFRGPDSTGLASIRGNGEVRLAKLANDPITLFDSQKFKHAQEGTSRVYMGHNRASTRGATNNFNAHPYHIGDIVGCHNGTLDHASWSRLEKAVDEGRFPTDSMALIAAINKLGIKEAMALCTHGKTFSEGAWSLVWYDQKDGTLNFLRNEHRPMWLSYAKDFKRILWASEWWMLDAAGHADGFDYHEEGEKGFRFFPTTVDTHYKFEVDLLISGKDKPKPKTKIVKGKEPEPVAGSGDPFGRSGNVCSLPGPLAGFKPKQGKSSSPTTTSTTSRGAKHTSSADNVIHWLGTKDHPYAGYISKEKFEEMAKYGCAWCSGSLTYGDPGLTIFERDGYILCGKSSCSGHNGTPHDPNRIYITATNFEACKG